MAMHSSIKSLHPLEQCAESQLSNLLCDHLNLNDIINDNDKSVDLTEQKIHF